MNNTENQAEYTSLSIYDILRTKAGNKEKLIWFTKVISSLEEALDSIATRGVNDFDNEKLVTVEDYQVFAKDTLIHMLGMVKQNIKEF